MARNWFGCSYVVFFFTSVSYVFAKAVHESSPCFAYVDLLLKRAGYAIDGIYGDAC